MEKTSLGKTIRRHELSTGLLPGGQELKLISLLSIVVALTHSSCCFSRPLHKGIGDGDAAVFHVPSGSEHVQALL